MTASTFVTDSGIQVPAVTAEQMRVVDRVAIEGAGPNLYQMMENAGRSLALTVPGTMGGAWAPNVSANIFRARYRVLVRPQ